MDEEVEDEYRVIEVPLKEALKLNKNAKPGDTISEEVKFETYSRSIAQLIRQLITQNVREKKKEAIYAKHKGLKGEMVTAIVSSVGPTHAILSLEDGTTAFMPSKFKNPRIKLSMGERVKVYVEDVLEESKDAQIIVSNGSKILVRRILELEVPEIAEGIVEIVALSRIPGERAKVAVKSTSPSVDAVGAIIGASGSRVKSIIEKLDGEKLDIIEFSDDSAKFVANALAPAKVIAIVPKKDEEGKVIEGHIIAITPNKHQTLAIGKAGSNARLAVELTNTRIDVMSIDEAKEKGLEFEWNGNVEPAELESIEAGIRTRRAPGPRRPQQGFQGQAHFEDEEINDDIMLFNESLSDEPVQETKGFDSEDIMFSEEDLDKMQAEFEFDTELPKFNLEDEDAEEE